MDVIECKSSGADHGMKQSIVTISNALHLAEQAVVSLAILGIAALTIANVFARSLFGSSLAIAEEVCQFLIIVVTFVGLSYAASLGRHIRMTAIYDQLPLRQQRRLALVVHAVTAILLFVLCGYACRYVYTVYQLGGVYSVTRLPFFVVYLVAPIGFALAGVQYVLALAESLADRKLGLLPERPPESAEVDTK